MAEKKDMIHQSIIELPGEPQNYIYEKSRQWIAETFRSSKAVIEYENKEEGVIIGNGSMPRPISEVYIIPRGDIVLYSMREDIKDNKARITFDKIRIVSTPSQSSIGGERGFFYQSDLDNVKTIFNDLTDELKYYILGSNKNNNW